MINHPAFYVEDPVFFEVCGQRFRAVMYHDDDTGAPWEDHDGHGPVSEWTTRDKRAGELVLNEDRRSKRFYDFAEACAIARRDGWGVTPPEGMTYEEHKATMTPRQYAALAARANFERLRGWCKDEWHWCGLEVVSVDDDDEPTSDAATLWALESDDGAYLMDTARELAAGILAPQCAA